MEVEKRKRVVVEEEERGKGRLKKLKRGEGVGESSEKPVVRTEEEVEEFFAILNQMRVAVKYFDEREKGRDKKEWREALEQADVTVADGVDVDDATAVVEKKEDDVVNQVLDWNTVAPEVAESGGA